MSSCGHKFSFSWNVTTSNRDTNMLYLVVNSTENVSEILIAIKVNFTSGGNKMEHSDVFLVAVIVLRGYGDSELWSCSQRRGFIFELVTSL